MDPITNKGWAERRNSLALVNPIMTRNIKDLLAQWQALELSLLQPSQLPDSGWECIASVESGRISSLRDHLPVTVACFKQSACEEICRRASAAEAIVYEPPYVPTCEAYPTPTWQRDFCDSFKDDVSKMHQVLFGRPFSCAAQFEFGQYTEPKERRIHSDNDLDGSAEPVYLCRVGGLAIEVIRNPSLATSHYKHLLDLARSKDGDDARQVLRDEGILTPVPLGHVILACTGTRHRSGTLHCSSPVSRPTPSAFLRCW